VNLRTHIQSRLLGLQAQGIQHQVDRTYREGGAFQWVRETLVNAQEAGAKRIHFGIEWQAVESMGVYRRLIADDGRGMRADELVGFFRTFGGGGKPIGGVHENYGVGSKTSLLPWNKHGIVVVSWVNGEAAMIWLARDPESGEYGLRVFAAKDPATGETTQEPVVAPFKDRESGCDWSLVKPDWITEHGTVVVLLGDTPSCSTIEGDPGRAEDDIKGLCAYLNRRIWQFPADVEVTVQEMMHSDRRRWPSSVAGVGQRREALGCVNRVVRGARAFIEYSGANDGRVASSGTVELRDGTAVDWYLWEGERPSIQSYAAQSGYVATLYRNELYDVGQHHATYRSFGITEAKLRARLWFVLRPMEFDPASGRRGIYSRTDRNALLISGGRDAGAPLPIGDWAADFADRMPAEILAAIRAERATGSGTIDDERWRERLAERFGDRWRITKLRARDGGTETVEPGQAGAGSPPAPILRAPGAGASSGRREGGRKSRNDMGSVAGAIAAARSQVAGGIPTFRRVPACDVDPGMLAAWQPHDPEHAEGVVLLNVERPVLETEIRRWQAEYPPHQADLVKDEVIQVFGELAVAKIAHSERLKSILPGPTVDQELRSPAALTMALLGLMGSDAVLADRLAGKCRRRVS